MHLWLYDFYINAVEIFCCVAIIVLMPFCIGYAEEDKAKIKKKEGITKMSLNTYLLIKTIEEVIGAIVFIIAIVYLFIRKNL